MSPVLILMVGEPVGGLRAERPEETPSTWQDCDAARRRARALAPDRDETSSGTAMTRRKRRGRRRIGWDGRPSRVKGRIGVDDRLPETRVARTAECRLEQKVGYDRHTDHTFTNLSHISYTQERNQLLSV